MNDQGKKVTVRWAVFGVAIIGLAGALSGCASELAVTGGPTTMTKLPSADFKVEYDTAVPGDLAVKVTPDDGDANLEAKKDPSEKENKIVWTSERKFGIKFVKIDNPSRSPKKKFGPDQSDGWNLPQNDETCGPGKSPCVYTLKLEAGKGNPKKEIRMAKYIVASPSGCNELPTIPAGCMWQDPVIIVRY